MTLEEAKNADKILNLLIKKFDISSSYNLYEIIDLIKENLKNLDFFLYVDLLVSDGLLIKSKEQSKETFLPDSYDYVYFYQKRQTHF